MRLALNLSGLTQNIYSKFNIRQVGVHKFLRKTNLIALGILFLFLQAFLYANFIFCRAQSTVLTSRLNTFSKIECLRFYCTFQSQNNLPNCNP